MNSSYLSDSEYAIAMSINDGLFCLIKYFNFNLTLINIHFNKEHYKSIDLTSQEERRL